jgi:pSer/pThr/pTyr-binding forkhead associated (FHA) protein
MTDAVLNALKLILLALVYLFFGRVLWAVWSEVRTPVATQGKEKTKRRAGVKGTPAFVMIEPRQHRGQTFTLSNTLTIGRVDDNDIIITDDSFVSSHHARIEIRPDSVWVVDLKSTNGTFVNGQRVADARSVRKGDRIQVGGTVLEMRQ